MWHNKITHHQINNVRFTTDGNADGYVDDGREIFDEDLDEKPTNAGFVHFAFMHFWKNSQ